MLKPLACGTHEDGCVRHRCPVCRQYRLRALESAEAADEIRQ
jgi:hypothetical protein